jgi:diacylglycerol O-acyltransferase/trehalose O-mycolyltransferase
MNISHQAPSKWIRRLSVAFFAAALLPALIGIVGGTPTAAAAVEVLSVPSPSMGRDITVQFQGGGPKAVYLLDGLRARDDRNGWDIETGAFSWFDGSGLSVVAPVGGMSSFYTDWYRPAVGNGNPDLQVGDLPRRSFRRGWPRTKASARPATPWSACRCRAVPPDPRCLSPGTVRLRRALSGFLNLSAGLWPVLVGIAMGDAGGFNALDMWGPYGGPAWQRNDPMRQIGRLGVQRHPHLGVQRQRQPDGSGCRAGQRTDSGAVPGGPDDPHQQGFPGGVRPSRRQQRGVQLPA